MLSRRDLLHGALSGAAVLVAPSLQAAVNPSAAERHLKFYNLHTGEKLTATFWADGRYVPGELAAIDHHLRDFRTGEAEHIDTALLERLHGLQQSFGSDRPFHVISGYRSPKTNAALRNNSNGVAKRSLHMQGRAIDIRLPGVDTATLRKAALAQQAGGVGFYPKSGFIHIDTGRTRFW